MERVFCAVCGTTYRIELHHKLHRSQGGGDGAVNLIPLCHECHQRHHMEGGSRLSFHDCEDGTTIWRRGDTEGVCRFYDPQRDTPSPELLTQADGERLHTITAAVNARSREANTAVWWTSKDVYAVLRIFQRVYSDEEARRRLTEWAAELDNPIGTSTLSKMLSTAILPDCDDIHVMPLAKRVRLVELMKRTGVSFEDALEQL